MSLKGAKLLFHKLYHFRAMEEKCVQLWNGLAYKMSEQSQYLPLVLEYKTKKVL